MAWIEVRAQGPYGTRDEAIRLLIDAGSPGVLEDEPAGPSETAGCSGLTAYLLSVPQDGPRALRERLRRLGWSVSFLPYTEVNWQERWKRFLRPVRSGGFLVRPVWSRAKGRKGEVVIEIDPGMAFGTGSHPSTRLCLRGISLLLRGGNAPLERAGCTLLDVGTGSGILAIAAMKLGIRKAMGIDIDPAALSNARKNTRLNNVKVALTKRPLEEIPGLFTLVVANIQSKTLLELRPLLTRKVRPEGFLLLSGILKEEAEEVKRGFAAVGLKPYRVLRSGEWAALLLRKV